MSLGVLAKGVLVGFSIAAPVGPIGVLISGAIVTAFGVVALASLLLPKTEV